MAYHIGAIIGAALSLLLLLAIILGVGKIPALRKYPLALHLVAVALVWLTAAVSKGTRRRVPSDARRDLELPPRGQESAERVVSARRWVHRDLARLWRAPGKRSIFR